MSSQVLGFFEYLSTMATDMCSYIVACKKVGVAYVVNASKMLHEGGIVVFGTHVPICILAETTTSGLTKVVRFERIMIRVDEMNY